MERDELITYVQTHFDSQTDYPWKKYPHYCVLRHPTSNKWFGLIMNVSHRQLGLGNDDEREDILVVKAEPELVEMLKHQDGFLPAYHMNKEHWISIRLNQHSLSDIQSFLTDSYQLTEK